MRRFGVPYSIYLVMIMNTIYALAREPVSYHTVRIDNLDIFYREAGPKNAPVLLLLHGVPTSSRMYQPMLESPLSARYRLIAPDFPGFGHSSWPGPKEFSYTFDHLAQVTERFAARNPAFDVTPADLIAAIVTEHGVHKPPFVQTLAA